MLESIYEEYREGCSDVGQFEVVEIDWRVPHLVLNIGGGKRAWIALLTPELHQQLPKKAYSEVERLLRGEALRPRLAYTAYTATSAFATAGFALLSQPGGRRYAIAPLAIPVAADLLAAATALYASKGFTGAAERLVRVLAAAFTLRAAGILLLPGSTGSQLLAVAELIRSTTATALATYYAATTRGRRSA